MTPWTASFQASLSFTITQSLFKLISIESVMPSEHLILCHPLLLPSVFPSVFPRSFPVSCLLHQATKGLELQLPHQSFQWIFRVISFNICCFNHPVNDIFFKAVQTSYDKHRSKLHSVQTQSCKRRNLIPWFLRTVILLWPMTNSPLSLYWSIVGDILIFGLPSGQKANLQLEKLCLANKFGKF